MHAFSRDRLRSVRQAFGDGGYPPIVAVKLGEAYFVIDGHHRAALARRSGAATIAADVTELIARVPLSSGADMLEVVLRELERIFLEDGGLADARPGVRISVSRPARYLELAAASGHVCTARAEATLARECGHDPIAAATFGREAVERRTKDCV